jgi:hypothetical protein
LSHQPSKKNEAIWVSNKTKSLLDPNITLPDTPLPPEKMCWSKELSGITLLIGTALNLAMLLQYKSNPRTYVMFAAIQWLLLMQFFEMLAWIAKEQPPRKQLALFAAHGAFVSNITQPIVSALTAMVFLRHVLSTNQLAVVSVIVLMYIIAILIFMLRKGKRYTELNQTPDCAHLSLQWWNDWQHGGAIYFGTLATIMLVVLRPTGFAVYITAYIALSLLVSQLFFKYTHGSMWCWFAAALPIVWLIAEKFCSTKIGEAQCSIDIPAI